MTDTTITPISPTVITENPKKSVKKRVRAIDKLDTKKSKFIQLYKSPESGGNISIVCSATGISRQTYYDWLEQDEVFGKAMYDAKMEKCDEMEQTLYQRGYEKSDTALIYWLKNNHPNYKEGPKVVQQFNVGGGDKNEIVFVNFRNGTES